MTAYLIDNEWKLQSLGFETKQMEEAHMGIKIATQLSEVANVFVFQE